MSPHPRALGALAILAAGYLLVASAGPPAVGAWQDDAIYLATAHSLAQGRGYRHPHVPGEPLQAKYPILYPALLAGVLRLAPEGAPARVALLAPTALAAAASVVLAALYWRRFLGASRGEVVAVGTLAALSPAILSMVRFTMSDLLYAALAAAAIYAVDALDEAPRARPEARSASRPAGVALAAGALVGAALLTRSIGYTLAAGAVGFLLWRRRLRPAAILSGAAAACALPWLVWQAWALQHNAPHATELLRSELSYGVWTPSDPLASLRVVLQNAFRIAFGLLQFQLAIPPDLAAQALARFSWRTAALLVAGFASAGLIAAGFAASARRRVRALHVCAALYAAVVLAYPGDPYRFLLPWAPFLLYFLWIGLGRCAARAGASPAGVRAARGALFALLLALFGVEAWRIGASTPERFHFRVTPRNWAELRDLSSRLRRMTAPGDVVASPDFAALFLETGRQGYYPWPLFDPYRLFYAPDRTWRDFFVGSSPLSRAAADREVGEKLADAYRAAGVDWYVDTARADVLTAAVRRFVRAHPEWFVPRYQTPQRTYHVYRVRLGPASPRAREGAPSAPPPGAGGGPAQRGGARGAQLPPLIHDS